MPLNDKYETRGEDLMPLNSLVSVSPAAILSCVQVEPKSIALLLEVAVNTYRFAGCEHHLGYDTCTAVVLT